MKVSRRLAISAALTASGMVLAGTTALASAPADATTSGPHSASALASSKAASIVASRPAYLHASADDKFAQKNVISSGNRQFVPFERTYKNLPVVGGDFVLVTDNAGNLTASSVAQDTAINGLSVTPKLTAAAAEKVARGQLTSVSAVESTKLIVHALGATPKLAYESIVNGIGAEGDSRLSVYVDAASGAVIGTREHILKGDGTAAYSGPNPLHIDTKLSGGTYSMTDPNHPTLSCKDYTTNQVFTKATDTWGNGDATNKETGCVDALFGAQKEWAMLSQWLGRNGPDGNGGAWPIRVGWNVVNAQYTGVDVQIGHNNATPGEWISSVDVVAHEIGHGIDDTTPGGISGSGTQEFVADTFGTATEFFANEPSPYDTPDYTIGEEINLSGNGPIRYMYKPSLISGHPDCYSSSVPSTEVHAAAGPGNHWFYLLAEGTNPTNGQPTSPTCNNTTLTGVGIQNAMKILYNAMLMKTTTSSYLKYRTWTLTSAKALDATCNLFNKTKSAWDAVSVPAQSGDPTCTSGTPSPSPTASPTGGSCSGQKLGNPGFETGTAAPWTATSGVIDNSTSQAPHSGSWKAWLDGYGSTHTDTLSQSVTIPAGCTANLSFWLHIDTAETTTTTQYDKLTVKLGTTTLATYSNLNKASGYQQRTFNVSTFAGQTLTLTFTGTEDSTLKTSFIIDDTALTLS